MAITASKLTTLEQLKLQAQRVATELGKYTKTEDLGALALKDEVAYADLATALKNLIDGKATDADLKALIGDDTGKTVRTIANEELAAQLIPEGAKEALDTLSEIAAWIQSHPDDASAMNAAIGKVQGIVAGIGGEGDDYATVLAAINGLIAASKTETDTEIAKKADKVTGATNGNFAALDADGNLKDSGKKAADFVAYREGYSTVADTEIERLAGVSTGANKTEASATNGYIKVDGQEVKVYEEPADVIHGSVATDAEVTTMLNTVFGAAE